MARVPPPLHCLRLPITRLHDRRVGGKEVKQPQIPPTPKPSCWATTGRLLSRIPLFSHPTACTLQVRPASHVLGERGYCHADAAVRRHRDCERRPPLWHDPRPRHVGRLQVRLLVHAVPRHDRRPRWAARLCWQRERLPTCDLHTEPPLVSTTPTHLPLFLSLRSLPSSSSSRRTPSPSRCVARIFSRTSIPS